MLAGLEKAELVITQDAFVETETNEYADVLLPAALWTESDGVMVNSERNLTLFAEGRRAGRAKRCQIGRSSPGSLARWGIRSRSAMTPPKKCSTRSSGSGIRRPATTCAGSATTGCGRRRCSGRAHLTAPPTATRSATINDGVSQTQLVRDDGSVPRLAFPTPSRPSGVLRPPAPAAGRDARRRLPVRAQYRSPGAPVAHHDQDRQGRQAQQAQPWAVRRDSPRRCRAAGHLDGDRSKSLPGAAAPCCRPWSPTGCGPATALRRSTGTTSSAKTSRSTRSPATPSIRYRASRSTRRVRSA